MLSFLNGWKGAVSIDGTEYKTVSDIPSNLCASNVSSILLLTNKKPSAGQAPQACDEKLYRITVKQYMTKPSTKEFDFMLKFNSDNPMPLCTMVGTIKKETPGMYQMELRADTTFNQVQACMKCGVRLTNPVSQFFGMGPECGGHNYVNPFDSDEELNAAVEQYKKEYLSQIYWYGWVIKSAITKMEEINNE